MDLNISGQSISNISFELFNSSVNHIEKVIFELEETQFQITANEDLDTIEISISEPSSLGEFINVETLNHPITELLGKKIIWYWLLENNQGYTDGFQLQVNEHLEFQFMVEASFIRISRLISLSDK